MSTMTFELLSHNITQPQNQSLTIHTIHRDRLSLWTNCIRFRYEKNLFIFLLRLLSAGRPQTLNICIQKTNKRFKCYFNWCGKCTYVSLELTPKQRTAQRNVTRNRKTEKRTVTTTTKTRIITSLMQVVTARTENQNKKKFKFAQSNETNETN